MAISRFRVKNLRSAGIKKKDRSQDNIRRVLIQAIQGCRVTFIWTCIFLDRSIPLPVEGQTISEKWAFFPKPTIRMEDRTCRNEWKGTVPPPRNGKPVKTGKRLFIPFPCAPFPTNCLRSKRGFSAAAGSRQQTHPTGPYRGFALRSHPSRESCPDGRIGSVPG